MKKLNKIIQNYRVLTNNRYRLITNIVIPVVLGLLTAVLAEAEQIQFAMFPPILMILAEMCGDYFGIGCICKKNGFGMDFLKTSHDGIKYFEDCLLIDILVRVPRIAIYFMIAGIPFRNTERFPVILFEMIAVVAICSIVSLNVLRYIEMSQYIMIMAVTFEIPAILGCMLAYFNFWTWLKWVFPPAAAVLLIAAIIATYYHMITKVRNSYKDM